MKNRETKESGLSRKKKIQVLTLSDLPWNSLLRLFAAGPAQDVRPLCFFRHSFGFIKFLRVFCTLFSIEKMHPLKS
jgi:hypothetical protein